MENYEVYYNSIKEGSKTMKCFDNYEEAERYYKHLKGTVKLTEGENFGIDCFDEGGNYIDDCTPSEREVYYNEQ